MTLIPLSLEQFREIQPELFIERAGPLVGAHVAGTGHGRAWADQWPNPRVALVESAGNYTLDGDPAALVPEDLRPLVRGFVDTPDEFIPGLRAAFPRLGVWSRVIYTLEDLPPAVESPAGAELRPLTAADEAALAGLSETIAWISKTWDGPHGLAQSGRAWGAFVDGRLASVACTFFAGRHYEDLGVVCEPLFQGRGLTTACAAGLCRAILADRRYPTWTTSTDHRASIRVAQKLGFRPLRLDRLFVIGIPIPPAP